jgi:uncharacterized protein (TIGR02271 family)
MISSMQSSTITAFFDSRSDAQDAVDRLIATGIDRDRIRLVPGAERDTANPSYPDSGTGFWEALKDLFIPDEDRYTYAEGLRRGGYLVTVRATADEYDRAIDILDDEGTIDIDERQDAWRAEGWTGYSGAAGLDATSPSTTAGMGSTAFASDRTGLAGSMRDTEEEVIPVVEEELRVGKRDVSHGRVRVRSYVVETPVTESVELRDERVRVERRPVDRAASGGDELFRDRTIELEERGEEAVIAKDARVREELVVKKDVGSRTETVSDTVRRTEVDVEDERTGRLDDSTDRVGQSRINRAR